MSAKRPTNRQKRAVDNIISGEFKTRKDALMDAGYSETMARNGHLVLDTQGVQAYLQGFDQKSQARFKMTLKSKLQDVFLDGLEAVKLYGKGAVEAPDYGVRLQYAERLAEMMSLLERKGGQGPTQVNFFMFDPKERQKFNALFNTFVRQQQV